MSAAIQRLAEEDPSLVAAPHQDTGETVLSGHGEMHLRVTVERLDGKNQIPIEVRAAGRPLSRDHPQRRQRSAAATRSSRAAMASSATW